MAKNIGKAEIRADFYNSPNDAFFDTAAVAIIVGRSIQWLHCKACAGNGIPFFKFGNSRKYRKSDVLDYMAEHARRFNSTSEYTN
ncbi:MAG: helix-turn-helix domain-containing protein [Rickettsiales bacterium]|jgi:hypothetical protein|nr:helix-turn-helix domain-containing protein [Rickettsiales bacterium]